MELTRFPRLNDEDSLEETAVEQRDSKKRVIRIFARLREVFETRVGRGIGYELWKQLLGDKPRQSLIKPHPDTAHGVGMETNGCGQDQVLPIGLEQINGADVGLESVLDQLRDVS